MRHLEDEANDDNVVGTDYALPTQGFDSMFFVDRFNCVSACFKCDDMKHEGFQHEALLINSKDMYNGFGNKR